MMDFEALMVRFDRRKHGLEVFVSEIFLKKCKCEVLLSDPFGWLKYKVTCLGVKT